MSYELSFSPATIRFTALTSELAHVQLFDASNLNITLSITQWHIQLLMFLLIDHSIGHQFSSHQTECELKIACEKLTNKHILMLTFEQKF